MYLDFGVFVLENKEETLRKTFMFHVTFQKKKKNKKKFCGICIYIHQSL